MKQTLLTFLAFLLVVFTANAQRTIIDFDGGNIADYNTAFNQGSGGFSVIANPDATGINQSDSVGQFIEATDGENWAGFYFDLTSQASVDLSAGQTQICMDVWVSQATNIRLKLEQQDFSTGSGVLVKDYEPNPGQDITVFGSWTTVCEDYAGTTFENDFANRFVFLFNVTSTPASNLTHYFDNLSQPNAVSTKQLFKGELIKVFPNPATYNIFFDTDGSPRTILVSDMMGRQMASYNEFTGNNIRVADYAPGTYIITFVDERTGQTASAKFVKR